MRKVIIMIIGILFFGLQSTSATLTLIDSYNETYFNGTISNNAVGEAAGQAFTNTGNHDLSQASFYLRKLGTCTYEYQAKLYNSTGTVGTNAHPTGAALAVSNTLNAGDLTTSHVQKNFTFASPYTLVDGYDYCIEVEITSWTEGFLVVAINNSNPTHAGNEAHNFGSGWAGTSAYDCIFWIYESVEGVPTPINLDHTKGDTWVNHTWDPDTGGNNTDSYNVSVNGTWYNGTTNEYYNNTPIPVGNWSNITVWAYNLTYNELSTSSVSENVQVGLAPHITAYYPTVTIWPEVYDSQLFNVTVDNATECRWYINGSLKQTNSTPSTTHSYTNSSLNGGNWNFTAAVNDTNGSDSQTWIFEVGADSIDSTILQYGPTTKSMIIEFDVTRIGSNLTDWGIWENYTFINWTYYYRYTNGTEIMNQTAMSNNESLWFNGTTLLPTGVYFVNATSAAVNTSSIVIPTNSLGMFNNWTTTTNFSDIAANESNDVCYSYYNVTSGKWESYYVGYSWNADYEIPLEASVFVFVDAETTVTADIVTPSNTNLYTGWNMLFVMGTDNETIADIKADIGANCTALWGYNSTAGAYSNTSSDTIQPCQGFLAYLTQNMTPWVRSDL